MTQGSGANSGDSDARVARAEKTSSTSGPLKWLSRPPENLNIEPSLSLGNATEREKSFLESYWTTQQQRVGQHETARYQFSAFVIAASVVALVQTASSAELTTIGRIAACVLVATANIFGWAMVRNELKWIKVHQHRSRLVLEEIAPHISRAQQAVNERWLVREDSGFNEFRMTSLFYLMVTHLFVVLAALAILIWGGR